MTIQQLNQLYYLKKEIHRDEEKLAEIKLSYITSPSLSNEVKSTGNSASTIERRTEKIDRLERLIEVKKQRAQEERAKVEDYISKIPDSRLRLIFSLRFVDMCSWQKIANKLGGGNTQASVKMMCYRYLKETEVQEK